MAGRTRTMNPRKKQAALFSILGVCLALLAVHSLRQWMSPERPGWSGLRVNVASGSEGASLEVADVHPLSPASRARFRVKDRVVAINGVSAGTMKRMMELNRQLKPGDTVRYTVRRDGAEQVLTVLLENPLRRASVLTSLGLNLVVGLVFLAVGSFVYWKRPADPRALIFFVTCSIFGLARLLSIGPLYAYVFSLRENIVLMVAMIGLFFFFFPALLHFCLIFPRRRPMLERHPNVLRWIYGLPAGTASLLAGFLVLAIVFLGADHLGLSQAFHAISGSTADWLVAHPVPVLTALCAGLLPLALLLIRRWWRAIRRDGWTGSILQRPGMTILTAVLLPILLGAGVQAAGIALRSPTGFRSAVSTTILVMLVLEIGAGVLVQWLLIPIAACVSIYRSYREASIDEKQQIRWPLWGIIIAVAGFFLSEPLAGLLTWLFRLDRESRPFAVLSQIGHELPIVCVLLIPVSFAFAILKHRLMEINVYIRKTVIYGGVTGLLALLYLGVVGGFGDLLSRLIGVESQWVAIASTLLVAVAFVPVRNRVQGFMDRRFFRRRDYTAALRILNREIAEAGEQNRLLNVAVDRLQEALQNRSVLLCLRPEGERAYLPAAKVGVPDELLEWLKFPADGRLAGSLTAITPALTAELSEPERRGLTATGCVLLAPIRRRGELLGFLCLGGKLSDQAYDRQDTEFLAAAADQIALGLDNLRFEEQQREFEKAREIQQALLPRSIPQASGFEISGAWQPARAVGGDYYDVLELDEGRLALVIADVSGKGIAAALLMSNLQAAVKAFAPELDAPRELCQRVNRMICDNTSSGKFITFFYAILDARNNSLVYSRAGHPPPILCRKGGGIVRLEAGGPILGFSKTVSYEQEEVRLYPGDRLLLFTDGLSEAFNAEEEEFGEERLEALLCASEGLGAEALQRSVLDAVAEFSHREFQDDATLIAVTVQEAGAAAPRLR